MELNVLLEQHIVLPSLPRVVALLSAELGAVWPNMRRVNQLFGADPALAARLLEEANSPAFAAQQQVYGIAQALALLDVRQLRSLAHTAAPGGSLGAVPGVNLHDFWRYSLNTAKLARAFAGLLKDNPIAAYTAGLLHGVGELALQLTHPRHMQVVNNRKGPLSLNRAKLEQRLLGYSYPQVSAAMAERWQLPKAVVDALRHHGAPFDNGVYEPLAGVLHLAAWRARAREMNLPYRDLVASFPGEVGVPLGLDIDMVLQQDPFDWYTAPLPGDEWESSML